MREELALFEPAPARARWARRSTWRRGRPPSPMRRPKVVYVLNRGGGSGLGRSGEVATATRASAHQGAVRRSVRVLRDPKTASAKTPERRELSDGPAHTAPVSLADGTPMEHPVERPLAFINWKAWHERPAPHHRRALAARDDHRELRVDAPLPTPSGAQPGQRRRRGDRRIGRGDGRPCARDEGIWSWRGGRRTTRSGTRATARAVTGSTRAGRARARLPGRGGRPRRR